MYLVLKVCEERVNWIDDIGWITAVVRNREDQLKYEEISDNISNLNINNIKYLQYNRQ